MNTATKRPPATSGADSLNRISRSDRDRRTLSNTKAPSAPYTLSRCFFHDSHMARPLHPSCPSEGIQDTREVLYVRPSDIYPIVGRLSGNLMLFDEESL